MMQIEAEPLVFTMIRNSTVSFQAGLLRTKK